MRYLKTYRYLFFINTRKGLFQYNRLLYGINSAPAIFQRAMENILQGIPHVLDDIILTGATKANTWKHWTWSWVDWERLDCGSRERNTHFSQTRLGHGIDQHGLHPVQDKVVAILKARSPNN